MSHDILIERQPPLATLILNRPEQRNAITLSMWRELSDLLSALKTDSDVRVLILTGSGSDAFSAGADIQDFTENRSDAAKARIYNQALNRVLDTLHDMPKPTIAMIRGYAIGGGCELAVATDLRIAAEGSRFGIPTARLGLSLSHREMRDLINVVGKSNALYMLLSARLLDTTEALRIGLVNQVVAADDLRPYTSKLAEEFASQAPLSHAMNKRIINQVLDKPSLSDLTPEEVELPLAQFETQDFQEGYRAFLEKRRPKFIGK